MHLDHRHPDREHRIAQRDAGMRESAGVEDQNADVLGGSLLNAADELMLRIALEADQLETLLARELDGALLDCLQGLRAVDPRLSGPQEVQIRAIEEEQAGHQRRRSFTGVKGIRGEFTLIPRKWQVFVANAGKSASASELRAAVPLRVRHGQSGDLIRDLATCGGEVDLPPIEVVHP